MNNILRSRLIHATMNVAEIENKLLATKFVIWLNVKTDKKAESICENKEFIQNKFEEFKKSLIK